MMTGTNGKKFPDHTPVNYGGEAALLSQSSPVNHMRPHAAPTSGQENVSGAESDFSAEQKMHCIPTGIA